MSAVSAARCLVGVEPGGVARLRERAPAAAAVVEPEPLELAGELRVGVHELAERRSVVDRGHAPTLPPVFANE